MRTRDSLHHVHAEMSGDAKNKRRAEDDLPKTAAKKLRVAQIDWKSKKVSRPSLPDKTRALVRTSDVDAFIKLKREQLEEKRIDEEVARKLAELDEQEKAALAATNEAKTMETETVEAKTTNDVNDDVEMSESKKSKDVKKADKKAESKRKREEKLAADKLRLQTQPCEICGKPPTAKAPNRLQKKMIMCKQCNYRTRNAYHELVYDAVKRQISQGKCADCRATVPDAVLEFRLNDDQERASGALVTRQGDGHIMHIKRMSFSTMQETIKRGQFVCGICMIRSRRHHQIIRHALSGTAMAASYERHNVHLDKNMKFVNEHKLSVGQCADCHYQFSPDLLEFAYMDNLLDKDVRRVSVNLLTMRQTQDHLRAYVAACDVICYYCWKDRQKMRLQLRQALPNAMKDYEDMLPVKKMLGWHLAMFGEITVVPLSQSVSKQDPRDADRISHGEQFVDFYHKGKCTAAITFNTQHISCDKCKAKVDIPMWVSEAPVHEIDINGMEIDNDNYTEDVDMLA